MAGAFFISDLHLKHKNILTFAGHYRDGDTVEEHDEILIEKINSKVHKRDKLFILGDVVWKREDLSIISRINGQKELIIGNHDEARIDEYRKYFDKVHGFYKYRGFWISHCPIHPDELRGCKNVHGHVHMNCIMKRFLGFPYARDTRYIPVTVEALDGYPICYDELLAQNGGTPLCGKQPRWEK
jgi:calcineurin-like phosphoesterase family protein